VTRFRRLAGRTKLSAIRGTGDVAGPVAVHQELLYRAVSCHSAAGKPLEALYVNHISYQVNDYKKVRDFYVDLLGMKVTEDNGQQCRLVFGNNILVPRTRANGGPARVDHIAYTVTNWDAEKDGLEEELKRRGLQYTGSAKTSFQVKDPEGMGVQFGGLHQ
jgi:catechol 2,3-dioxygenase-like lactoylglutathione lyase family enzyme